MSCGNHSCLLKPLFTFGLLSAPFQRSLLDTAVDSCMLLKYLQTFPTGYRKWMLLAWPYIQNKVQCDTQFLLSTKWWVFWVFKKHPRVFDSSSIWPVLTTLASVAITLCFHCSLHSPWELTFVFPMSSNNILFFKS